MIGLLKGKIAYSEKDFIILDVNNIGFQVYMTTNEIFKLPIGTSVTVHIHTHIREDAMHLFGFMQKKSLDIFKKLISVSGIGPRSALNILNSVTADHLVKAILQDDKNFLKKLPGIGPKSAAKIVLELKDKLSNYQIDIITDENYTDNPKDTADAIEALIALGYGTKEATEWVQDALKNLTSPYDTSTIISYVLKKLATLG